MSRARPAAFMSYAHSDDAGGRLTKFCTHLSQEVEAQTGQKFPIFQDKKDLRLGQNWKKRIAEALRHEVAFLIPIMTPSFFTRRECRDEVALFLARERELKRYDLILPVYYIGVPMLDDPEAVADDLARELIGRHYFDWRDLRLWSYTSKRVGERLAELAVQIRDALQRSGVTAAPRPPVTSPSGGAPLSQSDRPAGASPVQTETPTTVVSALSRERYGTISAAIAAASPGERIVIRPGRYREGLVLDKPLEIAGDGDPGAVVIEAVGTSAILSRANMCRITNLTLRQSGGGDFYAIEVVQGRLVVEDCDITSESLACVAIHGDADPWLRRNRIHDGNQSGIYVYDSGRGTIEDNDIFGHNYSGIEIKTNANPEIRHNRIHDCRTNGMFIQDRALGLVEHNEIVDNAHSGVAVNAESHPRVRQNRINGNGYLGIWIDGADGTYEDNDLRYNRGGARYISPNSEPRVRWARNQE